MEEPRLKCACANCGEVLEYARADIGQHIECPKCREKSALPEPPPAAPNPVVPEDAPETAVRRPKFCGVCRAPMADHETECGICKSAKIKKIIIIAAVTVVLVAGIVVAIMLVTHRKKPDPYQLPEAAGALPQPPQAPVKTPPSINDLKVGPITLQISKQLSNEGVAIAVGDIANISVNAHSRLKVELEVLDANGAVIGSLPIFMNVLGAGEKWHIAEPVTDPRAKSVRFVSLKEDQ